MLKTTITITWKNYGPADGMWQLKVNGKSVDYFDKAQAALDAGNYYTQGMAAAQEAPE